MKLLAPVTLADPRMKLVVPEPKTTGPVPGEAVTPKPRQLPKKLMPPERLLVAFWMEPPPAPIKVKAPAPVSWPLIL